jgi:hypothetical protein
MVRDDHCSYEYRVMQRLWRTMHADVVRRWGREYRDFDLSRLSSLVGSIVYTVVSLFEATQRTHNNLFNLLYCRSRCFGRSLEGRACCCSTLAARGRRGQDHDARPNSLRDTLKNFRAQQGKQKVATSVHPRQ